jgi:replicative DNA helicase
MDVEREFLSYVVLNTATRSAVAARITVEFFNDPQWRRVYEYTLDHWRKYSQPADEAVIHGNFPNLRWEPTEYSLEYLIDALRVRRAKAIVLDGLNEAAALVGSSDAADTWQMLAILGDTLGRARIETSGTYDVTHVDMESLVDEILLERMDNPGYLRGIGTGFKGIDYVTGGLQPEQLVVLIGLPKSLKSSILLWMALEAQKQAKRVLFAGFEMRNEEQQDRASSLLSGVGLTKILNGTITERERKEIMAGWALRRNMRDIHFTDDPNSAMTISGLQAKIMDYQPDVVFVDSAYLMQSELPKVTQGDAAALTDIARSLKRLSQSQKIPIVATTQASQTRTRGGKINVESGMYTQGWRQSADVYLGVERLNPDDPDDGEVHICIKVLATRSGPRSETYVVWDWSRGSCIEVKGSGTSGP